MESVLPLVQAGHGVLIGNASDNLIQLVISGQYSIHQSHRLAVTQLHYLHPVLVNVPDLPFPL